MMTACPTPEDRIFAAELMQRAGISFDAQDVGKVARALIQYEAEGCVRRPIIGQPKPAAESIRQNTR